MLLTKNGHTVVLQCRILGVKYAFTGARCGRGNVPHDGHREDLDRPDLCNKIDAMMARYGVSRDALHLEVTESAYVEDAQRVMGAVEELRSRGFIVEMDDFGSGYSSLNALKDIDIDKLKLDMRFLSG